MTDTAARRAWNDMATRLRVAIETENHQSALEIVDGAPSTIERLLSELPARERPALRAEVAALLTWAANSARVSRSVWIQDKEQVARLQRYHNAGQRSTPAATVTL